MNIDGNTIYLSTYVLSACLEGKWDAEALVQTQSGQGQGILKNIAYQLIKVSEDFSDPISTSFHLISVIHNRTWKKFFRQIFREVEMQLWYFLFIGGFCFQIILPLS